jgi:hypothetical protein
VINEACTPEQAAALLHGPLLRTSGPSSGSRRGSPPAHKLPRVAPPWWTRDGPAVHALQMEAPAANPSTMSIAGRRRPGLRQEPLSRSAVWRTGWSGRGVSQ